MNIWITYLIIAAILLIAELVYFKIAHKYNIIDIPNSRSSHKWTIIRGGGIIFAISIILWLVCQMFLGNWGLVVGYLPFTIGLVLICVVSFWDDIHSLPDSVRFVVQVIAMILMLYQLIMGNGELTIGHWWGGIIFIVASLIVLVGATNIINFMDGINGITAGNSFAVLVPLLILNGKLTIENGAGFIDQSFLVVALIGLLVFAYFNFRPSGKTKCFAGDVGSVGIAFIMLFAIGKLIVHTCDVTWLMLLLVYGIDGCLTIMHRIMLHENLGQAHRKHAYQIMANELKMSHVVVSCIYMFLQLAISLVLIYVIPNTVAAHWLYLVATAVVLAIAYVVFMRKYYHLHEEYLASLNK